MQDKSAIEIKVQDFNLDATLDCGQCFRWEKTGGVWQGIAHGRFLKVSQSGDTLCFSNATIEEIECIWLDYFDLRADYDTVLKILSTDSRMAEISAYAAGIRILRQEPWEALCSFILSQNNNIPRIKGLVRRLCENFGDEIPHGYSFPEPQALACLCCESLSPVRCGFRDGYIMDAAQKVVSGEINLSAIKRMDYQTAKQELLTIKGVGPKVADCTLLFGFYKLESFPQDVWIKRAVNVLFPDGLPKAFLPYAGIAQQFIFHYARNHPELFVGIA